MGADTHLNVLSRASMLQETGNFQAGTDDRLTASGQAGARVSRHGY